MEIFDYIITNVCLKTAENHPIKTIMAILIIIFLIVRFCF